MDTAFHKLEFPYKNRMTYGTYLLSLLAVLIVITPGIVTGFNYSLNALNIITLGFVMVFAYMKIFSKTLLDVETPDGLLFKHIQTISMFEKGAFVQEVIEFYAKKHGIKRPFLMLYVPTIGTEGVYAGVTTSKTHHVFAANHAFFMLPNDMIYAVIGHELGHIINKDIMRLTKTSKIFDWALSGALVHAALLSFSQLQVPYALLFLALFLAYNFIAVYLNLYIQRQAEFLADIACVKLTGCGDGMISLLRLAYKDYLDNPDAVRRIVLGLSFDTHPHFNERIELIQKAQSIHDKSFN